MVKMSFDYNLFSVKDKVVAVTGGAGGIGGGICDALAAAGAKVAILDISQEAIDRKIAAFADGNACVKGYACNITEEESVRGAFCQLAEELGTPYGLVNCAGISYVDYLSEMPIDRWQRVMDVNVRGTVLCTKVAGDYMSKAGGGRVVNISSLAATHGKPKYTAYTPSKAAVNAFTFTIAAEWAHRNINVNAIAPVIVITDINRAQIEKDPEYFGQVLNAIPKGEACSAELLAGTVIFLLSEASSYITGQCIGCDGGAENGDVAVIRPQPPEN